MALVTDLQDVYQLIKTVEKGLVYAGYEVAKEGFSAKHSDVTQANRRLLSAKTDLNPILQTERHLSLQDERLVLHLDIHLNIHLNG